MKPEFDFSYLDMVTLGDAAFRNKLLKGTTESISEKETILTDALAEQNVKLIRETAHSLKTLLAITGLPVLQQLMSAIEQKLSEGTFYPACDEDIRQFKITWQEAKKHLTEITENT